jgi:alkylation response protein AidB-like acyl-CoA dehydrogenase
VSPSDTMILADGTEVESLEAFRNRARQWLKEHMPRDEGGPTRELLGPTPDDEAELLDVERERNLQRVLFEGGFAGLAVPKKYGGQGLTPAHAEVFNEEMPGYQFPTRAQIPTFAPCMSVLLEFGNEEQKLRHIPAMLNGEELWMQFLSEPSGGSDVAGAQTTAVRDGDEWVLNGSKIWTTGAWWSDWGLCLARTNWDVPKHRGLSVFMLKIHQPGIDVHRIEMLNGSREFCQEFMTDVRVPDADRIGDVDEGWTVGVRWMVYERSFGTSPYLIRPSRNGVETGAHNSDMLAVAKRAGRADDLRAQELVGESRALDLAEAKLMQRLAQVIAAGSMTDQGAAIGKLMSGVVSVRQRQIAFDIAGVTAVAWSEEDRDLGSRGMMYLIRQAAQIAGGTTEMARNVVSERVLGMPRERTADRDVPYRDVPKGPAAR